MKPDPAPAMLSMPIEDARDLYFDDSRFGSLSHREAAFLVTRLADVSPDMTIDIGRKRYFRVIQT